LIPGSELAALQAFTPSDDHRNPHLQDSSLLFLEMAERAWAWVDWCQQCNRPLTVPPIECCFRKYSDSIALPMWFGTEDIPPLTNRTDSCSAFLQFLQSSIDNQQAPPTTVRIGDEQTYSQMVKLKSDFPEITPQMGPLHLYMHFSDAILRTWGDSLIRPILAHLGRRGGAALLKQFNTLDDLIHTVSWAVVRYCRATIAAAGFQHCSVTTLLCHMYNRGELFSPRQSMLVVAALTHLAPYCYLRALGRAGFSLEWLSVAYSLENVFHASGKFRYSRAVRSNMSFFASASAWHKRLILETILIRTNPTRPCCQGADGRAEKVYFSPSPPCLQKLLYTNFWLHYTQHNRFVKSAAGLTENSLQMKSNTSQAAMHFDQIMKEFLRPSVAFNADSEGSQLGSLASVMPKRGWRQEADQVFDWILNMEQLFLQTRHLPRMLIPYQNLPNWLAGDYTFLRGRKNPLYVTYHFILNYDMVPLVDTPDIIDSDFDAMQTDSDADSDDNLQFDSDSDETSDSESEPDLH